MKLKIEEIKIGSRIRQELGDLNSLKSSIKEVGLLSPILVNFEKELVCGMRRLEACRQLGWKEIEVKIVDTSADNVKKLDLEYNENIGRLTLTEEERQDYNKSRDLLLSHPEHEKGFRVWLKRIWGKIKSFFRRK